MRQLYSVWKEELKMKFEYCPKCGEKLIKKEIGDEGLVPFCKSCDKPWFDMFSSCIIALVVNEYNEAAILHQSYMSAVYANIVSGYIKPGESAEECAEREIFEEIGVKAKSVELILTRWFEKGDMLMIAFIVKANKCELVLSDEVDAAEWVPLHEALNMVHPKGSISYDLIEEYINRQDTSIK